MTPTTDPNYTPVLCSTCDPPSVVYVPVEWVVQLPYVCTCCRQRIWKKIQRDANPLFGRMKHGETREQ